MAERKITGERHGQQTVWPIRSARVNRSVASVHTRADWRSVEELYRQFSAIVNDPEKQNVVSDDIAGSLAESLARIFAHYDGHELQFMEDLLCIWSEIDGYTGPPIDRFRRLYQDERLERFPAYNPSGDGRRRPKPFEACIETCRRLMDLNRVRDVLAPLPSGGILGGSVSYGRFFNTCGAASSRSSDTDVLLVLPDYDFLSEVGAALARVDGLDKGSLDEFKRRIKLFHSVKKSYPHCIFNHKFNFWKERPDPYLTRYHIPGDYLLSLHVFSQREFDFMIVKDKPILQLEAGGRFVRELFNYRNTLPTRLDNQRSFNGEDSSISINKRKLDGGYLSKVRVCHIKNGRFFPGLHQNLILPQFEIRWELPPRRLYLPVLGFRWKILERLRTERQLHPFEVQKVSLSHTRSAVFAPHVTRRADRE